MSRYVLVGKQTEVGTMDPSQKDDTFISFPIKAKHGTQIAPTSHSTLVKTREGAYEVMGTLEGTIEPEGIFPILLDNVFMGVPTHAQQGETAAWLHTWDDDDVGSTLDFLTLFREEDLTARKIDAGFIKKLTVNFPAPNAPLMTYRAEFEGSIDSLAALDGSYSLSPLAPFSSLDQVTTNGHQLAESGDWTDIITATLEITNNAHWSRAQEGRFATAGRPGHVRVGGSITQRFASTDIAKRFFDGTTGNSQAQAGGITPFDLRLKVQQGVFAADPHYYEFYARLFAAKWPESDWNVVQLDDVTFVTPFISEFSDGDSLTFEIGLLNTWTDDVGTWPQIPA